MKQDMKREWEAFLEAFEPHGFVAANEISLFRRVAPLSRSIPAVDQIYRIDGIEEMCHHYQITVVSAVAKIHPRDGGEYYDHVVDIYLNPTTAFLNPWIEASRGHLIGNWLRVLPPDETKTKPSQFHAGGFAVQLGEQLLQFSEK